MGRTNAGSSETGTPNEATVLYRERLTPSLFAFLFAVFMIASLGIAYAHAYGNSIGWAIFALGAPISILAMVTLSPVVEINDANLRLGNALLPRKFVGSVHALDDGQTKDASGQAAHRSAYIVLRSWMPSSVIIEITDLDDPHPYWHFSTRHPDVVVDLLNK